MRGFVRQRGSTFTAYWSVVDPASGQRRQHSKGGFRTKGLADKHLNAVVSKVDEGSWRPDRPVTVKQLLEEHWLPAQRPQIRPATAAQYEGVVSRWIVPFLGGTRVAALTPAMMVDYVAALKEKGLSTRSTQLAVGTLKSACAWAVGAEIIGRNPVAAVKRPKVETPRMTVWTAAEARKFLEATRNDRLGFAWALLLTRGLRRGELCGLRWGAVDLEGGGLAIEETLITVEGRAVSSLPKTDESRRRVPLDPGLVALLRVHHKRQAAEQLRAAAGEYDENGYLVADELGRPYHPDSISGWFDSKVRELKLPRIRLHDCRHTAASLLLGTGTPVKVVSELLGHKNPTVTLTVYAHVLPGMAEEAAAGLSASLLG